FAGERLDVSAVGDLGIGHDGSRVRVREHHLKALGLERLAGLRAGVVKLRRLANDDGARTDDQDFGDVRAFGHWLFNRRYVLFVLQLFHFSFSHQDAEYAVTQIALRAPP